jgi:hypothetical protein
MDGTTKQRYISTSIWSDDWFDSLSTLEKLIYFHLLTNEFTNAAGVYHFSLKQIRIDLDISREEIQAAMEKFEAAGKAYYFEEYIIIPKWLKHQKISERNKIFLGVLSILRGLPDDIKQFIADRNHYDFPVEKYVEIPSGDGPCPVEDGPSPKKVWPMPKKGVAHAKNDEISAHDSDLDLDLDISGGGRSDYSDPPGGKNPAPEKPPPPPLLKIIKTNAAREGFIIGDDLAGKFLASGIDPAWFSGPHDFTAFMARKVRQKYPKAPPEEQRNLFIGAIAWDNLRREYPAWRDAQTAASANREKDRAKKLIPPRCECGAELHGARRCPSCGRILEFDETTWGFVFLPPLPEDQALSALFRDEIRSRKTGEEKTPRKPPWGRKTTKG